MTNATMTDETETETLTLGIVIAQGSIQSSMRPVLAYTQGDGRVGFADVGSNMWEREVDNIEMWEKEAHKAEYICETSDSVDAAIQEINDYGFNHVYPVTTDGAHDEFERIVELAAEDN